MVSLHFCKTCIKNCDCPAQYAFNCMQCGVCKATQRLINEETVFKILKSPMSPEDIHAAMNAHNADIEVLGISKGDEWS